jgi:type I restriction enzyme S subunit
VQEACFDMFLLPHPDADTIAKFAEHVRPLFRAVQVLADKNANLRRTRDLLLPKLISGEVDVEDMELDTAVLDE